METPKKKYTLTGSQDPERINFMYSPLPKDESVNPKHWDSKINFWKTEIIRLSRFNGECCFCLTKLKESFTDGGGRTPKGINYFSKLAAFHSGRFVVIVSYFKLFRCYFNFKWMRS